MAHAPRVSQNELWKKRQGLMKGVTERTSRVENDAFPLVIQRATASPLPYLHALCAAFNYLSQPWNGWRVRENQLVSIYYLSSLMSAPPLCSL